MPEPTPAPDRKLRKLRNMVGDKDPQAQIWSDTDLQDALADNAHQGDSGQEWDMAGAAADLLTEHLGTLRQNHSFETDGKKFELSDVFKQTSALIATYNAQRRIRSITMTRSDVS